MPAVPPPAILARFAAPPFLALAAKPALFRKPGPIDLLPAAPFALAVPAIIARTLAILAPQDRPGPVVVPALAPTFPAVVACTLAVLAPQHRPGPVAAPARPFRCIPPLTGILEHAPAALLFPALALVVTLTLAGPFARALAFDLLATLLGGAPPLLLGTLLLLAPSLLLGPLLLLALALLLGPLSLLACTAPLLLGAPLLLLALALLLRAFLPTLRTVALALTTLALLLTAILLTLPTLALLLPALALALPTLALLLPALALAFPALALTLPTLALTLPALALVPRLGEMQETRAKLRDARERHARRARHAGRRQQACCGDETGKSEFPH